jgi:hypothetical protein
MDSSHPPHADAQYIASFGFSDMDILPGSRYERLFMRQIRTWQRIMSPSFRKSSSALPVLWHQLFTSDSNVEQSATTSRISPLAILFASDSILREGIGHLRPLQSRNFVDIEDS